MYGAVLLFANLIKIKRLKSDSYLREIDLNWAGIKTFPEFKRKSPPPPPHGLDTANIFFALFPRIGSSSDRHL